MIIDYNLGCRVPVEWVAKEMKDKEKLQEEVKTYLLLADHMILCLGSEVERNVAMAIRPWMVIGSLRQ